MLFTIMQDHLILTSENALAFERSIGFLQQTLAELRRISFGMMPESLFKNGLDEALRQKCAEVSAAGSIEIQYHSSGLESGRVSPDLSIAVYRIIQELLNNIKRQTGAKTVYITVTLVDGTLQLHVQDDGPGMDADFSMGSGGSGLRNIQHRVDALKGNMRVDSVSGRGTTVQIALHI